MMMIDSATILSPPRTPRWWNANQSPATIYDDDEYWCRDDDDDDGDWLRNDSYCFIYAVIMIDDNDRLHRNFIDTMTMMIMMMMTMTMMIDCCCCCWFDDNDDDDDDDDDDGPLNRNLYCFIDAVAPSRLFLSWWWW